MNAPRLASIAVFALAGAMLFAGCGSSEPETPATIVTRLTKAIAEDLPPGWQAGIAKDSGVEFTPPTQPDDILVWKTEKVLLRKKGGMVTEELAEEKQAHIYFTISPRPFINVEDYPPIYKSNTTVKAQYDHLYKTVSHIPRNSKGEYMPRGDEEHGGVHRFKEGLKTLPPYDPDLPDYHYRGMAFKLRDWRTVLEPDDRKIASEQNSAYVVITQAITPYSR